LLFGPGHTGPMPLRRERPVRWARSQTAPRAHVRHTPQGKPI